MKRIMGGKLDRWLTFPVIEPTLKRCNLGEAGVFVAIKEVRSDGCDYEIDWAFCAEENCMGSYRHCIDDCTMIRECIGDGDLRRNVMEIIDYIVYPMVNKGE